MKIHNSSLVDAHCHLDLYDNQPKIIEETEKHQIKTISVTTTPRAWKQNFNWMNKLKYLHPALGIHPQLVQEPNFEIDIFKEFITQTNFVGEIGLDKTKNYKKFYKYQKMVLNQIFDECIRLENKILSIHAAGAFNEILDLINSSNINDNNRIILHWFSGSDKELTKAIDLDCYFSINVRMLRKRTLLKNIPLDRLLTETDGPFIKFKNKQIRPIDLHEINRKISKIYEIELGEFENLVERNLDTIIN